MFDAKYLSSSSFGVFLKEDILSFFFWLPWQPEFCMGTIFEGDHQRNIPVKFE
jgi:hypothetical protein